MLRAEGGAREASSTRESGDRDPRALACARCQRVITSMAELTEMNGSHEHVFVNPEGQGFRIGRFADARGLLRVGAASLEWTWFAGYKWQSEVCAGCREFLGWLYLQGEHRFHGLVLDSLIEIDEN